MRYQAWIHYCKWPNYDYWISLGSVATLLRWSVQNCSHLRQVSSYPCTPKIIKICQCFTRSNLKRKSWLVFFETWCVYNTDGVPCRGCRRCVGRVAARKCGASQSPVDSSARRSAPASGADTHSSPLHPDCRWWVPWDLGRRRRRGSGYVDVRRTLTGGRAASTTDSSRRGPHSGRCSVVRARDCRLHTMSAGTHAARRRSETCTGEKRQQKTHQKSDGASPAIWDQSHSVTCHPTQVNAPCLDRSQSGRYTIHLPRKDGRLSWWRLLYTYRSFTCRPTVTHPSSINLIATRLGVEPTTSWSLSPTPNHYIIEPSVKN